MSKGQGEHPDAGILCTYSVTALLGVYGEKYKKKYEIPITEIDKKSDL